MKKKILAIFSAAALALGACAFMAACDDKDNDGEHNNNEQSVHSHNYTESVVSATCAKYGYTLHKCQCGDSYKDKFTVSYDHNYVSGVCTVCNKINASMADTDVSGMQFFDDYGGESYYLSNLLYTVRSNEYIKVPATYNGKPVTRIGSDVFKGLTKLKGLFIPDSVTTIDQNGIADCPALTSVTLGKDFRFYSTSVFGGCPEIVNIEVSAANAKYSGEGNCLIEKDNKTVVFGTVNSVIPDGVEAIGMQAFDSLDKLTEIYLSDSVKNVSYLSFYKCRNLTSVYFGKNMQFFNNMSYLGCEKLNKLTVSKSNASYYSVDNCVIEKATKTLMLGTDASVIPDDGSVEIIGYHAFEYMNVENVNIPKSVKKIDAQYASGAFAGCSKLKIINYGGTKAGWRAIEKVSGWNSGASDYTVRCSDGNLDAADADI